MRLQTVVTQNLTIKAIVIHFNRGFTLAFICVLTSLFSIPYAAAKLPTSGPVLPEKPKCYIDSLSNNQQKIPAWLVAELLPFADHLGRVASSQPVGITVRLNELLAKSERYKSKVVTIEGQFVRAIEVGKELQLLPPDRCWSVILLDLDYLQPIQLFTSQDPSVFKKNSNVKVVGVFLTNRIDQPKGVIYTQSITIPVLVGAMAALGAEKSFTKSVRSNTTSIIIVTGIAILVAIFIKMKITLSRPLKPGKISQLLSDRGRKDGKGST